MPTKHAQNKKTKSETRVEESHTETEEVMDIPPTKSKKPLELDLPEPVIGTDEKPEVDPLIPEEETDETTSEEVSLDDDELNPFGDKWEQ